MNSTQHIPSGYKQTEVGVIPVDWEVKTIDDVASFLSGGTPSRSKDEYWTGDIPWISASTLRCFHIFTSDSLVTKEGVEKGSKMAPIGSTLLLVRGSALHKEILSGFVIKDVCFNQDVKALVPKTGINPIYLTFLTKGYASELLKLVSSAGNTAGVLDTKLLKQFKIVLPSKAEQEAIAEVLGDADAWIESLEKLIAKKRNLKQAAMQQLLTGQTRLPGFEGEWVERRLGDVAKIQRGASPRPIDNPIWFDENSETGWVRISDVTSAYKYLCNTTQKLSELGIRHSRPVVTDSLIMSICATVGRPIITKTAVCIHDGFVVFDELTLEKEFLFYFLQFIEPKWSEHGQTGSQMNLNTGLINNTVINCPVQNEQTAIAQVLSDMDVEIKALEGKLEKARRIKEGMMAELLTGKTRLVEPKAVPFRYPDVAVDADVRMVAERV
jgi:type I restriction enzyme S subunit